MQATEHNRDRRVYLRLAGMAALSFLAIQVLMYAMVNTLGDVLIHVNQLYMAMLMAAPMVLIELALMRPMYRERQWNMAIAIVSVVAIVIAFVAIRLQIGVGDSQFLRSMIPHHSSAILMCREASIEDPELRDLCTRIIASQQEEIDQMNAIRARLGG